MGEQNPAAEKPAGQHQQTPTTMTTVIPSRTEYLQYLSTVTKEFCRTTVGRVVEVDDQFYFNIELVLTEAVVNSIRHAYADSAGPVELGLEWSDHRLTLRVSDFGKPFHDFESYAARKIDELDPMSTSGRGIIIIRTLMDDLQYVSEPETGQNRMTMVKSFAPSDKADGQG